MKTIDFSLIFTILFPLLSLNIYANPHPHQDKAKNKQTKSMQVITAEIGTIDDLVLLFKQYNYTQKSWLSGEREVPRIIFTSVSENWKHSSQELPVQLKKEVFFRVMAPLVLMSNEKISAERKIIKNTSLDNKQLKAIAKKYYVIKNIEQSMDENQRQLLLNKVDRMPPSLVLAQAAEESGWATSRFTSEGNAFFGQWDFSGKGMIPKQQRKELGNYGLARFDSPLASVEGYMFNINTGRAYQKLRDLRVELREKNKRIKGLRLVVALDKYSERGQAYIDSISSMIRFNKLQDVDEAFLSDGPIITLVNKIAH